MKPKNFTELIQSNDYCENECEVDNDGTMSEAQHEACLGIVLNLKWAFIKLPKIVGIQPTYDRRFEQDTPIEPKG